ncbi:MAG: sulfatase-like hydrolase/transferase [Saprospiraceae bacterium]|nr:sulfatase-like hydrolase/transferase [Saprospiraceae bacterium]
MDTKPNLILILGGNHAIKTLSIYDNAILQTPNIDRIGKEGVTFQNAFVAEPFEDGSFFRGSYTNANSTNFIDSSLIESLKLMGYATYYVGKKTSEVNLKGFDEVVMLENDEQYYNPVVYINGQSTKTSGYVTKVIGDFSLEILNKRSKSMPFCLVINQLGPGTKCLPEVKKLEDQFDKTYPNENSLYIESGPSDQDIKGGQKVENLDIYHHLPEASDTSRLDWMQALPENERSIWLKYAQHLREDLKNKGLSQSELVVWKYQRLLNDYSRCIASLDEEVGRLLDYLDDNQLSGSTALVYTATSGYLLGEHGYYGNGYGYGAALHIPFLLKYDGKLESGRVEPGLVSSLDIAPTLLEMAGGGHKTSFQGTSLWARENGIVSFDEQRVLYLNGLANKDSLGFGPFEGMMSKGSKLVHYLDSDYWFMHDLLYDQNEMVNMAIERGKKRELDKMKTKFEKLKMKIKSSSH